MIVKKRDGRLEEFNSDKILESIKKAALAVEGKDDDIQHRAEEINKIKRDLIESGFDPDEAEECAEHQYEGYIEDGIYTEYDEEDALEVLDLVLEGIDSLALDEDEIIETKEIQEFVAKALIELKHAKTATEYIVKSSNRERVREMNTSLMRSFEDLTFGNSKEVETKRENANIDGDSSMGTMLKYGSEGAKKFNLLYLIPPEISDAHTNGDIHIHDLDFYSLTETCVTGDTQIVVKIDNDVRVARASDFEAVLGDKPVDHVVNLEGVSILSGNSFVKLKNCVRHLIGDHTLHKIVTDTGSLVVTENHVIPVERDGSIVDVKACDIRVGDKLILGEARAGTNKDVLNLIYTLGPIEDVEISNSDYVLNEIKHQELWEDFCKYIVEANRGSDIRDGKANLSLRDYFEFVKGLGVEINEYRLKLEHVNKSGIPKLCSDTFSQDELIQAGFKDKFKSLKGVNAIVKLDRDLGKLIGNILSNIYYYKAYYPRHMLYELFRGSFGVVNKNPDGSDEEYDIHLPEWIYSANSEFLKGFLEEIIGEDDTIQFNCKGLVQELQRLLSLNGVKSYIGYENKMSILHLTSGVDTLPFIYDDKHENVAEVKLNLEIPKSDTSYGEYVYDFETEDHYFNANGFEVHNCCQIDLEKLFKGGFNTGHGCLREPSEIRSYASLACIAIQSNQNDMHRAV